VGALLGAESALGGKAAAPRADDGDGVAAAANHDAAAVSGVEAEAPRSDGGENAAIGDDAALPDASEEAAADQRSDGGDDAAAEVASAGAGPESSAQGLDDGMDESDGADVDTPGAAQAPPAPAASPVDDLFSGMT